MGKGRKSLWHDVLQNKIKDIGEELGFHSNTEVRVRGSKGYIDCVWYIDKPILEYLIAFEFETQTSGAQIVENLVKVLSLPSQLRPRFLVQIYRDKIKEKTLEYIRRIASSLPVAAYIIEDVGNDVDKATLKIIIGTFNWICSYATISHKLIDQLRRILPAERVMNIFHYGELTSSHLEYLDTALRTFEDKVIHIISIPEDREKQPDEFKELYKFDVVIISDVYPKNVNFEALKQYIEEDVVKRGKKLVITGGWGLTKGYNVLETYLGGIIESKWPEKDSKNKKEVYMDLKNLGLKGNLVFKGFNKFRLSTSDVEVISRWSFEDYPALVRRSVGKGEIIIFTSDCSPAWGTPSLKDPQKRELFNRMWRKLIFK